MSTLDDQIADDGLRGMIADWIAAHHAKDAGRILSHYADGATTFSLAPPLIAPADDEAGLHAWLSTWEGPVTLSLHRLTVVQAEDIAVAYGLIRLQATTKAEGYPLDLWYRGTFLFERRDGVWTIAHQHESVPFYMDGSFKAATDLKP